MRIVELGFLVFAIFSQDGPVPNHPDVLKPRPGSEPKACDRRHVAKLPYCGTCKKFLDGSETVQENFCKACWEGKPRAEWVAADRRWACTKFYYSCEQHELRFFISGLCPVCNKPFDRKVDRVPVKWKCGGCRKEYDDARCADDACRRSGRALEAVCPKSATYPHVAEP